MDEINEDSCVLTLIELDYIAKAIEVFLRTDALNHRKFINCKPSQIFQKATKLNEMAKDLGRTGLYDKGGKSIYLDHLCKDGEGKLFRVDYHAAAYWANYQYRKRELLGNVTEQCEIITTYEEDYKSENPIWETPFKKVKGEQK